ncbi:MAG: biotin--[acetyl-CoA-carboxylase] ligase [Lactobacillales bacterium]|nr:biotin--[acetyl-CoA-carboxylase] ligase [Lactobacillales bacterium]
MKTKKLVLELLVSHPGQYVSGEFLGNYLNLSRTAIWKAMNELRNEGYTIESTTKKGYKYLPSERLSEEIIMHYLAENTLIETIRVVSESASTMSDAKLGGINGAENASLFVADMQTSAKGRFGREYFAQRNKGIYMSLLLHPNQTFENLPQYTVLTAVAVVQAIEKLTKKQAEIKWVNDIYIDGKKICGILSEASGDVQTGEITSIIIGIGMNFSILQQDFPEELQEKASSLFASGKPTITRNELIAEIWNQFFALMTTDFIQLYKKRSFVLGKVVSFTQGQKKEKGIAVDINNRGELIVELPTGENITLYSGEISLESIEEK